MYPSVHAHMTGADANELRIGGTLRRRLSRTFYVRLTLMVAGMLSLYLAGGAPRVRFR